MQALGPKQTEWLEALESGNYKQDPVGGFLSTDDGYCCLGVACALQPELTVSKSSYDSRINIFNDADRGDGYDSIMPYSIQMKLGFYSANGRNWRNDSLSCSNMNDRQVSFVDIAAQIRANPHDYFNEPA